MKVFQRKDLCAACVTLLSASLCLGGIARAQNVASQARIVEAVQNDKVVTLRGNVHPMARPANDRGSLPEQQPVTRMHVLLQRSADQEAALQRLLADQQDLNSSKFHSWLTPQEFGQQFGPAESDLQAVKDWLNSQGFTSLRVNNGRTLIEFNGTASQVRNAFHTEMHRLSVNAEEHFANMQEPQIPSALAPVVGGVVGLNNFRPKPMLHRLGKFRRDASTGQITPLFTFTDVNGTFYGVGPADFAKIYNVPSTFDGTGQSIAVVGQSNINLQDVRDFRSIFGLPTNDPQIILNGADPGLVSGDEGESDLDVEWAGAVAPKAQIILVTTPFTDTDGIGGVDSSAEYIIDNNVAPVLSESYGACESGLGTAGNAFYNALWQQAAAQGITVVVSAGDNGSAGCDDPNSQSSATQGIAVSGIASTPYNVAMGGTDFDQANLQTTFWNSTNGSSTQVSAKGYIPETAWNDSCANAATAGNLTVCANASATSTTSPLNIVAGSGGPSSIYTKTQAPWQTGFGDTTARDLPDVSLFSSDGQNKSFYIVCESDADITGDTGCNLTTFTTTSPFHDFQAVGGTSAAAPTFAGIIALVNVANLISKWTTATASGTSTSTTLSPASVTGTAGSVSGNLTGTVTGSGGTPTGVVILENATTSAPLTSGVLSGGSYSLAAALLPQGTYTVKAHYSGDGTFAPSESSAITITLLKQNSAVTVSFVTFTSSGAVAGISTAAQNVQYGSDYTLRVDVAGSSSGLCTDSSGNRVRTCPTGTVNLFDGTSALNDFPNAQNSHASSTSRLNDRGFTEDQPIQLNVGAHAIKATYTADATSSYNSQTSSNSLSVTITQATTSTGVTPSVTSITSGGSVTLTATVSSNSNSAQGPTGTVQFLNGSSNLGSAATCTPAGATTNSSGTFVGASCTAALTTTLSSLPPGFIDLRPRSTPFVLLAWLAAVLAIFSFLMAVKLAARRKQYAYAGLAFFLMAAVALAGCSGTGSSSGGGSSRSISAKYSGDTNYAGSTGSTTITVH